MSKEPQIFEYASGSGWKLHRVECCASASDRPFEEKHDAHLLAIVQRGTFRYHGATGRALLHAGAVLTANRRTCYCCDHTHDGGDTCLALQIDDPLFEEISVAVRSPSPIKFPAPALPLTASLLAGAVAIAQSKASPSVEDAVFAFAEEALRMASGVSSRQPTSLQQEIAIETSLRLIEARLTQHLNISDIAKDIGMSRYHFSRAFKRVVGLSPYDYILKQRLRRTATLLATSREPVSAIAYDCGFGDLSTFNAAFKSMFGRSPRQFRTGV